MLAQASSHEISFPANAQHELIIVTKDYYHTRIVREGLKSNAELKNSIYTQKKLYVEVSLISQGETLLVERYILVFTKNDFSLTIIENK